MKFLFKSLIGILIFTLIETSFYFWIKPRNVEAFFLIWGLIALMFLLFNILNESSSWDNSNFGNNNQRNLASFMGSSVSEGKSKEKIKRTGGLFDPLNLLYLLFIFANAIAYYITLY